MVRISPTATAEKHQTPTADNPPAQPNLPSLARFLQLPGGAQYVDAETATGLSEPRVPPAATNKIVRVALLLPMTGTNADLGKAMLNAAQLAVFDFADRNLELLMFDTRGSAAAAAAAVAAAIGDGISVVIGPLLASSVRAVAPAARAAQVPVVAFSSDHTVVGDGVYTLGFLPEDQVRRVVSFASSRGVAKFAVLAPDNAYGATVTEIARQTAARVFGEVTHVQYYDPNAEDFTPAVRALADYDARRQALVMQRKQLEKLDDPVSIQALKRLKNLQTIGDLPFEALLIADGGKRLISIAALLPFYDIDPAKVRMLGTGQWDVAGIGAEPALLGGWYAAPPLAARQAFEAQYRKTYGKSSPRLATLAYDVTALISVLARVEGGPDFSRDRLVTASGFEGRDGIFRFLPSGVAERGLAVMQVRKKDVGVISPAPTTFETVIN